MNKQYVEEVQNWKKGCTRGVMVKAPDCRLAVIVFELQLLYYVYFLPNTLGKFMNPLVLPDRG